MRRLADCALRVAACRRLLSRIATHDGAIQQQQMIAKYVQGEANIVDLPASIGTLVLTLPERDGLALSRDLASACPREASAAIYFVRSLKSTFAGSSKRILEAVWKTLMNSRAADLRCLGISAVLRLQGNGDSPVAPLKNYAIGSTLSLIFEDDSDDEEDQWNAAATASLFRADTLLVLMEICASASIDFARGEYFVMEDEVESCVVGKLHNIRIRWGYGFESDRQRTTQVSETDNIPIHVRLAARANPTSSLRSLSNKVGSNRRRFHEQYRRSAHAFGQAVGVRSPVQ